MKLLSFFNYILSFIKVLYIPSKKACPIKKIQEDFRRNPREFYKVNTRIISISYRKNAIIFQYLKVAMDLEKSLSYKFLNDHFLNQKHEYFIDFLFEKNSTNYIT